MPFKRKIAEINNVKKRFRKLIDQSVLKNSNIIEDSITEEQLFKEGKDGLGVKLPAYSPKTVFIKKLKGQPFDRTTLKDEGIFHNSIKVKLGKGGILIDSDPIKEDTDLIEVYGEEILFLAEENLTEFRNIYLKDDLIDGIRAAL